ncbi:hypothetical protein OKA04_04085 [Luteolibacter flavescens]|uniref:Zinc-finger domain-containing protein n=1 Tax=Luteolibacter flavescens TaxID=1859460 RepID=A0ABT3FJZ6_9BACT|nr:hypothetical protein [Luteolibacter flavescens]MCW1883893.1 hypothetical protein [Luteolibacter flavescens]
MMPSNQEPDAELRLLVSRFIDQTITPEESRRLDERLQGDPAALDHCVESMRFDALMRDALDPQPMELEEIRRVSFDPRTGNPLVTLSRRIRIGDAPPPSRFFPPWLTALLALLLLGVAGAWWMNARAGKAYGIRNGDFENMDLSQSVSPVSHSILFWQDPFSTDGSQLCDLNRMTSGQFFAKSGRNVVLLRPQAFLNQLLLDGRGKELPATPGLRVRVRGWYLSDGAVYPTLRCSLRFVAGGYPAMVQYEAAGIVVPLEDGGWHSFEAEMVLPEKLWTGPTVLAAGLDTKPPAIDLQGKSLTLSLDNYSENGELFLDDLSLEVIGR